MTRRPTVILVTHDLREAAYLADRIFVMSARPGRVMAAHEVRFPRPRTLDMTFSEEFVALNHASAQRDQRRAHGGPRMIRKSALRRALPWLVIGGMFLAEALCRLFNVPEFVLPLPSQIFAVLFKRWDALLPHATQTLMTTVIGFIGGVIAGTLIGIAIGSSRLVYDAMYPLLVGFYSIPKVAWCRSWWCGSGRARCRR